MRKFRNAPQGLRLSGFRHPVRRVSSRKCSQSEVFLYTKVPIELFISLFGGAHQEQADQQRQDIQHDGDIQHILVSHRVHLHAVMVGKLAGMVHDPGSQLIACQPGNGPCGKGEAVDGADIAHAVMVGEQSGHVGEPAAVACVYNENQAEHQDNQQGIALAVFDAACQHDDSGKDDGQDEDQLIYGIPVLHFVRPCGEAEASARVEDGGYGGDYAGSACQADTFHDHLLLGDQGQAAGDVDVEHKPDADIVGDRPGLDDIHHAFALLRLIGLMPGIGLLQQQMSREHHHKIHHGQNQEHLVDAAVAQIVQHGLHDGAGDGFRRAEACNRKAGGKAFPVLKPEHQGLHRGQIAGAQADAHDETVAYVDADQSQGAVLMGAPIVNEESGSRHAACKADGGDQG